MRLLNVRVVEQFARKHADARQWLTHWAGVAGAADWKSLDDLRRLYPAADGVALRSGNVVTVFNVKGNEYRLLTYIDYRESIIVICEILSHAEYSKNLWKKRL